MEACLALPWDLILATSTLAGTVGFILGAAFMLRKWEDSDAAPRR